MVDPQEMQIVTKPLISVVVPTYNRARLISIALKSVLAQNSPDVEIVVVDDGSTDNTAEVVRQLNPPGGPVRYVPIEHSGVATARNRGLGEAKGDFVLWLDSDDFLLNGVIDRYIRVMRENPDIDVFYGNLLLVDKEGRETGTRTFGSYSRTSLIPALVDGCAVPHPGTLVRCKAYDSIGGYDASIRYADDYEWFSRAAGRCSFMSMQECVCAYRNHGAQLCGPNNVTDKREEVIIIQRMAELYGLVRMFPGLFAGEHETGLCAAQFRLASTYMERGGVQARDAAFDEGVRLARNGISAKLAQDEATCFLYGMAMRDREGYKRCAGVLRSAWPGNWAMLKQSILSLIPEDIHRLLRSMS